MPELNDKEQLVLYGLVHWPELNDSQLSEKIDVKRTTLTTIKHKLEKNGFVRSYVVPDLRKLGVEVLNLWMDHYTPNIPFSKRINFGKPLLTKYNLSICEFITDSQAFSIQASPDITTVSEYIDEMEQVYLKKGFYDGSRNHYDIYPLAISEIVTFFDFSAQINNLFGLGFADEIVAGRNNKKVDRVHLTPKEREVLYALVKYPELTLSDLVRETRIPRGTASRIHTKFKSDGLVRTVRIPEIRKLGLELIVYMTMRHGRGASIEERAKYMGEAGPLVRAFLSVAQNTKSFDVSVFRNYSEFQELYEQFYGLYAENGLLLGEPKIGIIPTRNLRFFAPLAMEPIVRSLLNINESDILDSE